MKRLSIWSTLALVLLLGFVAVQRSGAFSIRDFLGLDQQEDIAANDAAAPAAAKGKEWAKPDGKTTNINLDQIQSVLANVAPQERSQLLADKDAFHQFVEKEANANAVLQAAEANKVQQEPNTKFLMQRAAENVLREVYLNKLIASKIPSDFPSDKQLQEYYDKHKDKFVIGERIHVWQIFMPIDKNMSKKQQADVEKQAAQVDKDLKDGKIDFNTAALKYSANPASRNNGGYMGLVNVNELKPGIQTPLLKLAEGKISDPIKTDDGIHILKRGGSVPGRTVSLDEVKPQVQRLLVNQARQQLLKAVLEQARKTYPVALTDDQIEEWRLRLRTNMASDDKGAPPAGKK